MRVGDAYADHTNLAREIVAVSAWESEPSDRMDEYNCLESSKRIPRKIMRWVWDDNHKSVRLLARKSVSVKQGWFVRE